MSEWETITTKKSIDKERYKKRVYLREIYKEYPWVLTGKRACNIQSKINIVGLVEKSLCDEWINFQKEGWRYIKVIKGGVKDKDLEENLHILPLDNSWGDVVLFKRIED